MTSNIALGIGTLVVAIFAAAGTIYAPIIALKVQRKSDEAKEQRQRKIWIFKTLMGNRATRLNNNFVQAINMIDIEFVDPEDKEIRDTWKELLNHYTEWGAKSESRRKIEDKADVEKSNDLLADMLVTMGRTLGYQFDRVYIKKGFYYPEGLGNIEAEQHALRKGLLALLSGKGMKLPVAVFAQDFQTLNRSGTHLDAPDGLKPPVPKIAPPMDRS